MKHVSFALALMAALAWGGVAAAAPAKPSVSWAKNWQVALAEAKARNVPVFVSFHMDG